MAETGRLSLLCSGVTLPGPAIFVYRFRTIPQCNCGPVAGAMSMFRTHADMAV